MEYSSDLLFKSENELGTPSKAWTEQHFDSLLPVYMSLFIEKIYLIRIILWFQKKNSTPWIFHLIYFCWIKFLCITNHTYLNFYHNMRKMYKWTCHRNRNDRKNPKALICRSKKISFKKSSISNIYIKFYLYEF